MVEAPCKNGHSSRVDYVCEMIFTPSFPIIISIQSGITSMFVVLSIQDFISDPIIVSHCGIDRHSDLNSHARMALSLLY
jgi:hypothetical protein